MMNSDCSKDCGGWWMAGRGPGQIPRDGIKEGPPGEATDNLLVKHER
jgi:hypothetical protein